VANGVWLRVVAADRDLNDQIARVHLLAAAVLSLAVLLLAVRALLTLRLGLLLRAVVLRCVEQQPLGQAPMLGKLQEQQHVPAPAGLCSEQLDNKGRACAVGVGGLLLGEHAGRRRLDGAARGLGGGRPAGEGAGRRRGRQRGRGEQQLAGAELGCGRADGDEVDVRVRALAQAAQDEDVLQGCALDGVLRVGAEGGGERCSSIKRRLCGTKASKRTNNLRRTWSLIVATSAPASLQSLRIFGCSMMLSRAPCTGASHNTAILLAGFDVCTS
jgi:hypothetical protein